MGHKSASPALLATTGARQVNHSWRNEPAVDTKSHSDAQGAVLAVLKLRAWARAYLWHVGEYDLHEAVDPLQEAAERNGVDPDTAQQVLATAFAPFRGPPQ